MGSCKHQFPCARASQACRSISKSAVPDRHRYVCRFGAETETQQRISGYRAGSQCHPMIGGPDEFEISLSAV